MCFALGFKFGILGDGLVVCDELEDAPTDSLYVCLALLPHVKSDSQCSTRPADLCRCPFYRSEGSKPCVRSTLTLLVTGVLHLRFKDVHLLSFSQGNLLFHAVPEAQQHKGLVQSHRSTRREGEQARRHQRLPLTPIAPLQPSTQEFLQQGESQSISLEVLKGEAWMQRLCLNVRWTEARIHDLQFLDFSFSRSSSHQVDRL